MSMNDVRFLLENHREETINKADELIRILEPIIRIYSPTCKENQISMYVKSQLQEIRKDLSIYSDEIGNVFVTTTIDKVSPTLLFNAHLDVDASSYEDNGLPSVNLRNKYNEFGLLKPDEYNDLQLGYDDKIGIAIILWLLEHHPKAHFKALFTVHEEAYHDTPHELIEYKKHNRSGGVGIEYALRKKPTFFDGIQSCILIDRAEDKHDENRIYPTIDENCLTREELSDIITRYYGKDMCSQEFKDYFESLTRDCGTPMISRGSRAKADAYNINMKYPSMNIINLTAGGYNEHQRDDYLNIIESVRTLRILEKYIAYNRKL
jgi:di/tripeptidase